MAIIERARFKPDINRSSLETLVAGLQPRGEPTGEGTWEDTPRGTVVLPVQIIAFSDTDITAISSYVPGDPATERHITVIVEDTLSYALEGFAGMTAALVQDRLEADLDAWAARVAPAVPLLRRVIRAAKRTPTRAVP